MIEVHNISLQEAKEWWSTYGGAGVEYKPSPQFSRWTKALPHWTADTFKTEGPWSFRKVSIKSDAPERGDAVVAPKHYALKLKNGREIECIHVIEALGLDWHLGNALKYIWRAGRKDPTKLTEDLEKAVEILNRKIALLKGTSVAS